MTSQEKAKELVSQMWLKIPARYTPIEEFKNQLNEGTSDREIAKQCAIICVDEILEATKKRNLRFKPNTVDTVIKYDTYWLEVKTEINKL